MPSPCQYFNLVNRLYSPLVTPVYTDHQALTLRAIYWIYNKPAQYVSWDRSCITANCILLHSTRLSKIYPPPPPPPPPTFYLSFVSYARSVHHRIYSPPPDIHQPPEWYSGLFYIFYIILSSTSHMQSRILMSLKLQRNLRLNFHKT